MIFDCHTHKNEKSDQAIFNNLLSNNDLDSFYSLGIHPWDATLEPDIWVKLSSKIVNKKCIALGEIGLDKLKGPNYHIQKQVFTKQIELSEKVKLPVIIHCVRAFNELFEIKKVLNPKQKWIIHGFVKPVLLDQILKAGMMISVGSAVFDHEKLQEILPLIPDDRLLLETDDSSIPISEIYDKVAQIKNITFAALEKQIEQNFKQTFTKWQIG